MEQYPFRGCSAGLTDGFAKYAAEMALGGMTCIRRFMTIVSYIKWY
jgi:hypothetical protein